MKRPTSVVNMTVPTVTIYTDGGCRPNPGPGGWAALLIYGKRERELVGSEPDSTNNRMELRAAIEALRALKEPCLVDLHTDSQYLQRGITSWLPRWVKNGWRTSGRRPVKNQDVWQELHAAMQRHDVRWHWVRGHAGDARNARVDRLARRAIGRGGK
jgi:ribonuclease HI